MHTLQLLTDMSFSCVLTTERRSFLRLNYLTFGTVHRRATGGRGAFQALLRLSGWWQKPREDAAEKSLLAIVAEMTGAVMKGLGGGQQSPKRSRRKKVLALGRIPLRRTWWDWNIHTTAWSRRYSCCHFYCLVLWRHCLLADLFLFFPLCTTTSKEYRWWRRVDLETPQGKGVWSHKPQAQKDGQSHCK